MPAGERATPPSPARRLPFAAAVGVEVALFAALLPLLRVISAGAWLAGALVLAAALLGAGLVARRLRWRTPLVPLAQLVLWAFALTGVFFSGAAWAWIVPNPAVVAQAVADIGSAIELLEMGTPPLTATPALSFLLVGATGLLAIVLDVVVIAVRLPLLGAIVPLAVAVIPAVVVPGSTNVWQIVLLGGSILFLLWNEARTRPGADRRFWSSSSLRAVAIAAIAVLATVVIVPFLPSPTGQVSVSVGGSASIDASLSLGSDLRESDPVEVLQVRTSQTSAPYLRAATLSTFDGDEWQPDTFAAVDAFPTLTTDSDIAVSSVQTHVEIADLYTRYLLVPFPATQVDDLTGQWSLIAENRTVVAVDADSAGQSYTVTTTPPQPTLQQMRAATAGGVDSRYTEYPDDTPDIVATLADQVTAGTTNDFDAATALQTWFRSDAFTYSLDAPVEQGFDGSGVEAVAEFLRVRAGYCEHFASAFALMARYLGMPTRIVVGYLPGTATGASVDGETVYSVVSTQLHAWPEVYFEGIGWTAFEPTKSLGTTTQYASATTTTTAPTTAATTAAPTTRPQASATLSASATSTAAAQDRSGGTSLGTVEPAALVILVLVVVLLCAAPGALAARRRRRLLRRGDAAASWLVVQETAIDLGIPVPPSDSPRMFGDRLRAAGAPADAVAALVAAIEHASYAPAGASVAGAADTATRVRSGLLAEAGFGRRMLARVAPRSLVIRPGSPLAVARGAGSRER
ncbi:MAG: DUF3488 and transglutaminase-like domain-containing protein [Microbacterium sp.]|uniref:transglutaminase family protein n=1 Tax=Microbacterium sp. TaxID=51671 RepID=UPI0039E2D900